MTTPTVPIPPAGSAAQMPSVVNAGVRGLVDNASRLGLTWGMLLGTVQSYSDATNTADVILDGDTDAITAKCMLSEGLIQTQRVYVIQVPPSGYFVAGIVGQTVIPPVYARAFRVAGQTISNTTWTNILLDTEDFDSGGIFTATSTDFVVPRNGIYCIAGSGSFVTNATGHRGVRISVNGGPIAGGGVFLPTSPSDVWSASVTVHLRLTAFWNVGVQVFHSSGAPRSTSTNSDIYPSLSMHSVVFLP